MWNLWNIQIQIAEFLSVEWTFGQYTILRFGTISDLDFIAYGTGPGVPDSAYWGWNEN